MCQDIIVADTGVTSTNNATKDRGARVVWATNYYSLPLHMLYGSNIYSRDSYSGYYITPDIWQYHTLLTLLNCELQTQSEDRGEEMSGAWPGLARAITVEYGQMEDKGEAPKVPDTSKSGMENTADSETFGQKKGTLLQ